MYYMIVYVENLKELNLKGGGLEQGSLLLILKE